MAKVVSVMTDPKQSQGRAANGAIPGGKPDASTSGDQVRKVGKASATRAGPDGPKASEIGNSFKRE
jgi:hypothetical protein